MHMDWGGRIARSMSMAAGLGLGLAGGCLNIGAFNCSDSNQCLRDGEPGFCQPMTGFCSYADPVCPTGFRYGDEAGDGLAGECVPPAEPTTGMPVTTAPMSDGSSTGDAESSSGDVNPVTTLDPSTTTNDPTGTGTGDTCGGLDMECCAGDVCDDGLSCFGGTCGCVDTMAAGTNHTCVTRTDGKVLCWGANDTGQLGVVGVISSPLPVLTAESLLGGEGLGATAIDASNHTCALREDGNAVCWGENTTGASVPGLPSKVAAQPTQVALAAAWQQLAVGTGFSCIGRSDDFLATCFGSNNVGQLTGVAAPGPVDIEALFSFAEIDGGTNHTCGRTATGEMYCWGDNAAGQLGVNPATVPFSATVRQLLVPPVGDIAVGRVHTCARVSNEIQCWGDNSLGQLGDGTMTSSLSPVTAILPNAPIANLWAHGDTTCARMGTGEVYCWGDNQGDKLLIVGQTANDLFSPTPLLLDITDAMLMPVAVEQVVHGSGHGCILSDMHQVMCWGLNAQGQAGTGLPSAQVLAPEPVAISCE